MQASIVGRVSNYKLPPSKALLPLFEAVVNSLHSIEESGRADGKIDVLIERIPQQSINTVLNNSILDDFDPSLEPIVGFTVKDNGIGFNDEHFASFLTSDSTFKADKGGKGIGRFAWLKAFGYVSVTSSYFQDGKCFHRGFDFKLTEEPIHNLEEFENSTTENETIVKLIDFKESYRSKCPKGAKAIASRIIEHCLFSFLREQIPEIRLIDEFREEEYVLNDLFKVSVQSQEKKDVFQYKSQTFYLTNLRIYSSEDPEHQIHFSAQDREVESEKLHKHLNLLRKKAKIQDLEGKYFTYMGYVSSPYLDESVNSERTGFNFQDKKLDLDFPDQISKEEIMENVLVRVEAFLSPFLSEVAEESYKKIIQYIEDERPQYRLLIQYKNEKLKKLPPNLTEAQLDIELYKIYTEVELELKEKSVKFVNEDLNSDTENIEQRKKDYLRFIEESNAWGKSKLVEYIVHRRVMLDLFEKRLSIKSDGKYYLEKDVHNIIFPLRKTSNEISYDQQNLWIVDERLAYHRFLASDKEFSSYEGIEIESVERPDIAVFDSKFAFVGEESPFSSVTLIEFKRPMRTDYPDSENPVNQIYDYVEKIRSGKARDKNGRSITVSTNTPFYAYIVCDITPKIRVWAKRAGIFTPFPHNDGFFGYSPDYMVYVEIVSFDKLISDAKKRNAVLFDQLNIRFRQ